MTSGDDNPNQDAAAVEAAVPASVTSAPPADEALAAAEKELAAARAQAAEYLDGWQRARAEFANYKKRVEREQAEAHQSASGRILARYLDVLDDFERALKDLPAEGEAAQWASGVALIHRKLQAILEAEGVARIEALGQTFDPAVHEAVAQEDSPEHASGQVIDILRHGYRQGERVIRPAMVRVAR